MNAEEHEIMLKQGRVCRYCLTQQQDNLGNIFQKDTRLRSSAPLTVQIMSCASLEVYPNDGLPMMICLDCRILFEHSYRFRQMCKKAETLLKQYPLTGKWPTPLPRPRLPPQSGAETVPASGAAGNSPKATQTKLPANAVKLHNKNAEIGSADNLLKPLNKQPTIRNTKAPIKILNATPVSAPEPPAPIRVKKEKLDVESEYFLNKIENNDELSMDDVQRLIDATDEEPCDEFQYEKPIEINRVSKSQAVTAEAIKSPSKPKILNKLNFRILNKEANVVPEPRLSIPTVKHDEDGNMEIITEILDPLAPVQPPIDHTRSAEVVETNVFPCDHCERSFPLRQLRDIHMANHNRERSFSCEECEKTFLSKYDLKKHSITHLQERPFKCTICDKGFTRKTLLQRHEKLHTEIPKFICIYCEMPFISKEEMVKHTEKHTRSRPYQCKHCEKSFAFKQGLERHEVIHSMDQPFPCQYCNLSFPTAGKLARHLTAHAGSRPYPCKYCHKSYLLSHHLSRHLRSHYNTQGVLNPCSFTCTECNCVFSSREELIQHSVDHAGELLKCTLCARQFSNIEAAKEHVREHGLSDAYACEFCDLIFLTSAQLEQHIEKDHIEDMEAYHADEAKNAIQEAVPCEDNNLQRTLEDFFKDEELQTQPKLAQKASAIKNEAAADVPKILNDIIVCSNSLPQVVVPEKTSTAVENNQHSAELMEFDSCDAQQNASSDCLSVEAEASSSKTRKLADKGSPQPIKRSSPAALKRKLAIQHAIPDKKSEQQFLSNSGEQHKLRQPSINSMLKPLSKAASPTRIPAECEVESSPTTAAKRKIQRVTKSEAAAMVKEGRITIKDGNMVLTRTKKLKQ